MNSGAAWCVKYRMRAILAGLVAGATGLLCAAEVEESVVVPGPESSRFATRVAELEAALAERESELERLTLDLRTSEARRQTEKEQWGTRLAIAEEQRSSAVRSAESVLAAAKTLRDRSKKELRLAKESLGRALQLVDEAKLRGQVAERAMAEARRRASDAERAEAAWQTAEAAADRRERDVEDLRRTPVIVSGGYPVYGHRRRPLPCGVTRKQGPVRIPRTGTGSDLPSPISGIPLQRR